MIAERVLGAAALFSTMLVVGSSRAAPPALVPMEIRSEAEPLVVDIYPPDAKPSKDAPIARCTGPCRAMLAAGRYKLFVHGGEGTVSGSRIVDVSRPVTFTVSPKSTAQRAGGLALGIAGPAMILAGGAMRLSGLCRMGQGDSYCSDDIETKESIGTALLVSGGIVAAFGWVLYAQSFNAGVKQTPLQYALAPALFPRGSAASDHVPGFVFTGTF